MTKSQVLRMPVAISAYIIFFLISTATSYAGQCFSPGLGLQGMACENCTYEGSLVVTRDEPCERPFTPGPRGEAIEYLGSQITQRAKRGIAGVDGNTLAYAPSKGFVGSDDFTVRMNYRLGKQVGKFFIHFVVTVQ